MDSSIGHLQQQCHQHNSGLLRYHSAPSSLLVNLVGNTTQGCVNDEAFRYDDHHSYIPPTSSEMETILSKLMPSNNGWSNLETLQEFGGNLVKQEQEQSHQNGYSSCYDESQVAYQSQQKVQGLANGFDGSFGVVTKMDSENNNAQSKMGVRNCSNNLIRQKSSPAGFFSNENDLATLRDVRSFRASDVSNSGLHGTLSFPSRPSSCLKRMPQIAENDNEGLNGNSDRNLLNDNDSSKCYRPSFTNEFWDSSSFNEQKATREDEYMFSTSNSLDYQDSDYLGLTQHMSLPSTSSTEMGSIEKFLQIQGSVPCKIRAKRGFATHPRSIAERVRRTRISERIKKLQDLFPKSDKQTSTAEMLDLAVEYIKDLQGKVKILTDIRTNCKCTSNQKQYA